MGHFEECNPDAFEKCVYKWEKIGTYGVEISVGIDPMHSITVLISVGWEQHKRIIQTNLRIGTYFGFCTIDLRGNRYNEDEPFFSGKGLATCAVNTAIQFLLPFYKQPELVSISDNISTVDDQWVSKEKQVELAEKRKNFWRRFGFQVGSSISMSCKLSDLKLIKYGKMLDEFDRFIPIEEFRKDENHNSLYELISSRSRGSLYLSEVIPKDLWATRPIKYSPSFL